MYGPEKGPGGTYRKSELSFSEFKFTARSQISIPKIQKNEEPDGELIAEKVVREYKQPVSRGPAVRIKEETIHFFCEEVIATSEILESAKDENGNEIEKSVRIEKSCPLPVKYRSEPVETKFILFSQTYRRTPFSRTKSTEPIRAPEPIDFKEDAVGIPRIVTSVIWSQLTRYQRGVKTKARKAKPLVLKPNAIKGPDYLGMLIRQCDLEIHVTNAVFRKFKDPKEWLGNGKSAISQWLKNAPDAKNISFTDRMRLKALIRTVNRHPQHFL